MAVTRSDGPAGGRTAVVPLDDPARQNRALADELRQAFESVGLDEGQGGAGEIDRFEEEFAEFCRVDHCVGVASGSAGLRLGLVAAGVGPGDEVLVPAYTHIATALAVIHAGATPVLCDVRADTGLIDAVSARALVGPRTAAIVAVHLNGQIGDMDELRELAHSRGLLVIEDAAQSPGAAFGAGRFQPGRAGSLGDFAAFSFAPGGCLSALGEAGAVCTKDGALARRARSLRSFGERPGGDYLEPGFNARLDALQAAFLRVKLRHLDEWNESRRAWARMYRTLLPRSVTTLWEDPRGECVYRSFPIRVPNRDALRAELADAGIETDTQYAQALHSVPALAGLALPRGGLGASEEWSEEEVSLPMFPELTGDEVERVARALIAAIEP
jgi:dTDP-3-amino-3,4,6-trideoxy-alpha-D-glucose transaminase